jgi:hypothetical protein
VETRAGASLQCFLPLFRVVGGVLDSSPKTVVQVMCINFRNPQSRVLVGMLVDLEPILPLLKKYNPSRTNRGAFLLYSLFDPYCIRVFGKKVV